MLGRKIATAYGLFRDGGVKRVYDYSWVRLQMLAQGHKKRSTFPARCRFRLDGITDGSSRIELIMNNMRRRNGMQSLDMSGRTCR